MSRVTISNLFRVEVKMYKGGASRGRSRSRSPVRRRSRSRRRLNLQ